jgi:hypothetical protein
VLLWIVNVEALLACADAATLSVAVLPLTVLLTIVKLPVLKMAPPSRAKVPPATLP